MMMMTNQVPPGGISPDYVFKRPSNMPERLKIPLAKVVKGRWQPRRVFNKEKLTELASSINEFGVLTPIKAFFNENKRFELIAGERRTRASQLAGLEFIPAEVVEWTARQIQEVSIIDNLQRENLTAEEEGHAFELAVNTLGISEAELSRRMGKGRTYIQQRRQIAGAPQEMREALASGQISFSIARGLLTGTGGEELIVGDALEEILDAEQEKGSISEKEAKMIARSHLVNFYEDRLASLGWGIIRCSYDVWQDGFIYDANNEPSLWPTRKIIKHIKNETFATPARKIEIAGWVWAALKWRQYIQRTNIAVGWVHQKLQGSDYKWVHYRNLGLVAQEVFEEIEKTGLKRRGYSATFKYVNANAEKLTEWETATLILENQQGLQIGKSVASWRLLERLVSPDKASQGPALHPLPWRAPEDEPICTLCKTDQKIFYSLEKQAVICKPCETGHLIHDLTGEPINEAVAEARRVIPCRTCGEKSTTFAEGADGPGSYCDACIKEHKKAQRKRNAKVKAALALSAERVVAKAQYDYTTKKILALLAGVDISETLDEIAKAMTKVITQRYAYDALANVLYTEIETMQMEK